MKCICCNTKSTEDLVTNEKCPFYFTPSDMGVKCSHCCSYTCGACIKGFLDRGCSKYVKIDRWSYDMSYFQRWGILPCNTFQCHACEWNHEKDNARMDQKRYLKQCKDILPHLGMLCFYEFGILVTAPLQQLIDIHACAKYKSDKFGEFGAWHCVIDVNTAQAMKAKGIETDGTKAAVVQRKLLRNVCVRDIHPFHNKRTCNILWLMMRQIMSFPDDLKHKQPNAEDLSCYLVIKSNVEEDYNVVYVSGEYTEAMLIEDMRKQTCLLVRFANYCVDPSGGEVLPMLNALRQKICGETHQKKRSLKKEFFECRRHSGSSGLTCINTNFLRLLEAKCFFQDQLKPAKSSKHLHSI